MVLRQNKFVVSNGAAVKRLAPKRSRIAPQNQEDNCRKPRQVQSHPGSTLISGRIRFIQRALNAEPTMCLPCPTGAEMLAVYAIRAAGNWKCPNGANTNSFGFRT